MAAAGDGRHAHEDDLLVYLKKALRPLRGEDARIFISRNAYWLRQKYPATFQALAAELRKLYRQYT